MRRPFTGCGTALVTPFKADGSLDEAGRSPAWHGGRSTPASISSCPCGTTGEVPTLTDAEQVRVVRARRRRKRKGASRSLPAPAATTRRKSFTRRCGCASAGADGILSVTPYYNKPTPEGLFQHYRAIAEAAGLPIVVYNVPGRTGCNVDPATLVRLSTIPNIAGVKEASGNVTQMCEICAGRSGRLHRPVG